MRRHRSSAGVSEKCYNPHLKSDAPSGSCRPVVKTALDGSCFYYPAILVGTLASRLLLVLKSALCLLLLSLVAIGLNIQTVRQRHGRAPSCQGLPEGELGFRDFVFVRRSATVQNKVGTFAGNIGICVRDWSVA